MLPAGPEETRGSLLPEVLLAAAAKWKSTAPGAKASWQSQPWGPAGPELHDFSRNREIGGVRGCGEQPGVRYRGHLPGSAAPSKRRVRASRGQAGPSISTLPPLRPIKGKARTRPPWCQQGPRPQRPYWFSAFTHQHRLGSAPEACRGRSHLQSSGLGCSGMRRLCGLMLFKVGLGFGFSFLFSCVFAYQGRQANLFIYYMKKRGRPVKELSSKTGAAQGTAKRETPRAGVAEVRFGRRPPRAVSQDPGRAPRTDGL